MSRYILTAPAKQDIKDIKNYIARNNKSAARKFLERFRSLYQI
jgi:toxin ParE1/3/4